MCNDELYRKWNKTTARCYARHFVCDGCIEYEHCHYFVPYHPNEYGIENVKYFAMKTFSTIGLKGIKKYLDEEER